MSFGTLLETALAGSLRRDPAAVLPAFADLPPEDRLLRSASYAGLRRLAGRPLDPVAAVVVVEPCGPEALKAISPAAGARLLEILAGQPALLLEWLDLAEQGKWRVSHDCLPELLDHAIAHADIHDRVMLVGGERLSWLANLKPEWHFAARIDPDEQFATGTPTERARALRRIRRQNPARGRQLLEAVFYGRTERAETRSVLLDALREGLSAADEPLVQQAVQDSRKELREKGLRLICRIPDSRFAQRWIERAHRLVVVREHVVDVREPGELDPVWLDDGLDPHPPKGMGATAWIIQQTLAFTPPSIWPHDALPAIQRNDWSQPLLSGLAQAAAAYAEADWCETLLLARANVRTNAVRPPGSDTGSVPAANPADALNLNAAALLRALAPDRREAVVVRLLEVGAPGVAALIASSTHPWSQGFSQRIMAHLPELIEKWQHAAGAFLHTAALRIDPTVLPEAEHVLETAIEPSWARPALQRLVKTLRFRLAMRQELQPA
ncbi:MAG TPA: DUF5691 domain-containing protein [Chloroflexota bacterium]|nr:DUF5691 domain-containing protein [Chloroflexota bacterium]